MKGYTQVYKIVLSTVLVHHRKLDFLYLLFILKKSDALILAFGADDLYLYIKVIR